MQLSNLTLNRNLKSQFSTGHKCELLKLFWPDWDVASSIAGKSTYLGLGGGRASSYQKLCRTPVCSLTHSHLQNTHNSSACDIPRWGNVNTNDTLRDNQIVRNAGHKFWFCRSQATPWLRPPSEGPTPSSQGHRTAGMCTGTQAGGSTHPAGNRRRSQGRSLSSRGGDQGESTAIWLFARDFACPAQRIGCGAVSINSCVRSLSDFLALKCFSRSMLQTNRLMAYSRIQNIIH